MDEETTKQEEFLMEAKGFFELNKELFADEVKAGSKVVSVDYMLLAEHFNELADNLIEQPDETIELLEIAIREIEWMNDNSKVRIFNLSKSNNIKISEIRSKHISKLIEVTGVIRQTSEVRPRETSTKFECSGCGSVITIIQNSTKQEKPGHCSCGLKSAFKEIAKNLIDSQVISLEESHDSLDHSGQPKKVGVLLTEDLTEPIMEKKTTPGSRVTVIGVLSEIERIKNGAKSLTYEIIINANNIIPMEDEFQTIEVTDEDKEEIKKIAEDNPLEQMVKSFAPSICGYENIKRALVLQLFGGNRILRVDGTSRRGDINILLVGDAGVAKSQLLKYTGTLAPKSRYVSGMSTSGVGVTASVVRDEMTGDWTLQAGAMVLANNGHILIDELDKMSPEDRSNLHEAMATQQITVSKANIQATLNTKTAVLAAANPKMGRFDGSQSIVKQINLVPTLLSRFDCIFIVRDIPNKDKDSAIADRILSEEVDESITIDSSLLRKYVSHAKSMDNPKMTDEARAHIKNFYVGLRNKNRDGEGDAIPMGARQLESLIRIAEASARVRLADEITNEDAKVAIDIMMDYLHGVGYDKKTGKIDIDKIYGIGKSERDRMKYVLSCVDSIGKGSSNGYALFDDVVLLINGKIDKDDVETALIKLNRQGDIIKTSIGYKKIE